MTEMQDDDWSNEELLAYRRWLYTEDPSAPYPGTPEFDLAEYQESVWHAAWAAATAGASDVRPVEMGFAQRHKAAAEAWQTWGRVPDSEGMRRLAFIAGFHLGVIRGEKSGDAGTDEASLPLVGEVSS